jgi:hypothetical protein
VLRERLKSVDGVSMKSRWSVERASREKVRLTVGVEGSLEGFEVFKAKKNKVHLHL